MEDANSCKHPDDDLLSNAIKDDKKPNNEGKKVTYEVPDDDELDAMFINSDDIDDMNVPSDNDSQNNDGNKACNEMDDSMVLNSTRKRKAGISFVPDVSLKTPKHSGNFHKCKSPCSICHDAKRSRYRMSNVKVPVSSTMSQDLLSSIKKKFPDVFKWDLNITLDTLNVSEMSPKIQNEKLHDNLLKTSSADSEDFEKSEQSRKELEDRKKRKEKKPKEKKKKYPIRSQVHYTEVPTEPMTLRRGKVLSFTMEPIFDDEQNIPNNIPTCEFCSKKFLSDANLLRHLKYAQKREQAKKLKEKEELEKQENLRKEEKKKALNDKRNKKNKKIRKKKVLMQSVPKVMVGLFQR